MGFFDSIQQNINQTLQNVNDKINKEAVETFRDVVKETPNPSMPDAAFYSKGLLVNQWYPKFGGFSSEISSAKDDYGFNSLDRINVILDGKEFLGKDGEVSLSNNVSYAIQADKIGWYFTAPYAMVDKAIIKAKARIK